jgi:hypothetical protein
MVDQPTADATAATDDLQLRPTTYSRDRPVTRDERDRRPTTDERS